MVAKNIHYTSTLTLLGWTNLMHAWTSMHIRWLLLSQPNGDLWISLPRNPRVSHCYRVKFKQNVLKMGACIGTPFCRNSSISSVRALWKQKVELSLGEKRCKSGAWEKAEIDPLYGAWTRYIRLFLKHFMLWFPNSAICRPYSPNLGSTASLGKINSFSLMFCKCHWLNPLLLLGDHLWSSLTVFTYGSRTCRLLTCKILKIGTVERRSRT